MKKTFLLIPIILLFSCKKANEIENKLLIKNDTIKNETVNQKVDVSEKTYSNEKNEKINEYVNKYLIDNVLNRILIEKNIDKFGDIVYEPMVCRAECKFSSQTNTLTVLNEYNRNCKYKYIFNGYNLTLIDNNNDEINYTIVLKNFGVVFATSKITKFKTSSTNPFVHDVVGFVLQNKEYFNSYSQLPAQIK